MAASNDDYKPTGHYETLGDREAFPIVPCSDSALRGPSTIEDVTGSESSSKAIIVIFDAFGFRQPTLRGADLLASSLPGLVVMPDLFNGDPADPDWFPTDTEEKARALEKFKPKAYNATLVPTMIQSAANAKLKWPSVQAWGCFGLGWGGKLVAQASGMGTPFKVSGQAYPSQPTKEDAEKMVIPHICLASSGEAEKVKPYAEVFSGEGRVGEVETYSSMSHGWMGTKSDLSKEENVMEFERGYKQAARFFAAHL
ncbi:hypothetical protein ACLMJK_007553 [Lecanora helva]